MTATAALRLNALGLLAICVVLGFAFADQLLYHDLPCPLCLLQRAAMVAAGFGLALNLALGLRTSHYALVSLGALAGAIVSARQILLHIVPGTGAYGDAFFGLHFYTWAFIVFGLMLFGTAVMLLFEKQFDEKPQRFDGLTRGLGTSAFLLFGLLAVGNGISTVLECGVQQCPENPAHYLLLYNS